jgi:hypothetical protein
VQSDGGVGLDEVEVDFVAQQFSDVVDAVPVQCQPLRDLQKLHARVTYLIMVGLSKLKPQP